MNFEKEMCELRGFLVQIRKLRVEGKQRSTHPKIEVYIIL